MKAPALLGRGCAGQHVAFSSQENRLGLNQLNLNTPAGKARCPERAR